MFVPALVAASVCIVILGIAAVEDVRCRIVPRRLWRWGYLALPFAALVYLNLFFYDFVLGAAAIGVAVFFVLLFRWLGLHDVIGGADARGLMLVSAALPVCPLGVWPEMVLLFPAVVVMMAFCGAGLFVIVGRRVYGSGWRVPFMVPLLGAVVVGCLGIF